MKSTSVAVILVMSALGFLLGYQVSTRSERKSTDSGPYSLSGQKRSDDYLENDRKTASQPPQMRSTVTLDSLIKKGASITYGELALWLVDANVEDIAAYWRSHEHEDLTSGSNGDMRRLIFFSWTRLDPLGAVAAVAGTPRAMSAWHAWGANDPLAALAAANPEQAKTVANGIGQMQPDWLRKNFDQIPKDAQQSALNGLTTWSEDKDLKAKMDFLKTHNIGFHSNTFIAFAHKDPWAAYEWLQKNNELDPRNPEGLDILLNVMKSAHPDDLERMAAITPSGELKRKMEDAFFENLLATDPEAALAQAKSIQAPMMSAKRLATIGTSLLESDPERAFQLAAEILAISPGKLSPELRISIEDSYRYYGLNKGATENFMESLMIKDPSKTLHTVMNTGKDELPIFSTLTRGWAERDLSGYADWVNRQTDSRIHTSGKRAVVDQLSNQGHFHEAAEWVMSGETPDSSSLSSLGWQWARSNPQEALDWVESSNLSEKEKTHFIGVVKANK